MRHSSYSHETYLTKSEKKLLNCIFVKKKRDKYRVKIENMRGEPALGMEVREVFQRVQEEELEKKKKHFRGTVCAKVLKQKTGGLKN